jgi:hypothetical protein
LFHHMIYIIADMLYDLMSLTSIEGVWLINYLTHYSQELTVVKSNWLGGSGGGGYVDCKL